MKPLTDKGARAAIERYFASAAPPLIPQEVDDVMRWAAKLLGIATPSVEEPYRSPYP